MQKRICVYIILCHRCFKNCNSFFKNRCDLNLVLIVFVKKYHNMIRVKTGVWLLLRSNRGGVSPGVHKSPSWIYIYIYITIYFKCSATPLPMLVIIYKWITLSGLKIFMQNRILDESRDTELSIALNLSCKEWLSTKIYAFEDRHLRAWLVSEPLISDRYLK